MSDDFRWSFDDNDIGQMKLDGRVLDTRLLARAEGMKVGEWYEVAKHVCHYLNQARVTAVSTTKE